MWKRWHQTNHIWERSTDNGLTWGPLPLNAASLTEGTLIDSVIPTNIPRMNILTPGNFIISGAYFENYPTFPNALGYGADIPFLASNFSAVAPMTWTVGSAAIIRNKIFRVGKLVFWSFYISWFSGSNVLGGSPSPTLKMLCPVAPGGAQVFTIPYQGGIAGIPVGNALYGVFSAGYLEIGKNNLSTNFAISDTPGMIATIMYEGV